LVVLNRIYTKTGDAGSTSLGTGERRVKSDLRIEALGSVDEANAAIGLARLSTREWPEGLDAKLARIQNDLFDLGADLCVPPAAAEGEKLRIAPTQVERLEADIDELNAELSPLRSFVLPGGSAAAGALHLARAIARRAERVMVALGRQPGEQVGGPALQYINRLSDFLFVAARWSNDRGAADVLWRPGGER
jgi:cob(I)alamin adenosyltransferase